MKQIIFLLRSFNIGGAERQLILLAAGLKQHGYSVKIAVFYGGGPLEAEAIGMGLEIADLKRNGRWDLLPFFFRLIGLIRSEKPDVLHSYLQVPNIWSAFVKMVLPRTKVVWGIRASNMDMKKYGWQWQLTDKVEFLLAKIPDWIICNSQAGLLYHAEKGYPVEKMSVIHNGINTEFFLPNRELGQALRKQWGIGESQKLIGMAARMDPVKDYPNFLHAASLLLQECKDVYFVCIGGGSHNYIQEYRELAYSLNLQDHLIWAGERTDMLNVYNSLDIFVLSSISEGISNVIGEAMACGVPCVATDVGDATQLIDAVGEIVPPQDSRALKQGILNLLNRLELEKDDKSIKKDVVRRINEIFNVGTLVDRTADLLDQLIEKKTVNREVSLGA